MLLVQEAAAEVFELDKELAGGGAGDAGLADGGEGEVVGGEACDVDAEGAVVLDALAVILLAEVGFGCVVGAGAAGTGLAVDEPAFFERSEGAVFAGESGGIEIVEAGVEGYADQVIFKEKAAGASSRHGEILSPGAYAEGVSLKGRLLNFRPRRRKEPARL